MAILIDLSQVVLSACYAFKDQLTHNESTTHKDNAINLIRHTILSQLKYYNVKYKSQYGKMIVCTDGKKYWRKQLYPFYKATRKALRAKVDIDWNLVFHTMQQVVQDLKENFLFPVINVEFAESDDVIATLTKYFQTNELIEDCMFDRKQDILIVSSDKDFVQLHVYDNVKQISPVTKRFVSDPDPKRYLAEKVLKGDRGDGIMNVLSDDDAFIANKRCSKMTSKRINALLEQGIDNCDDPIIKRNWERNKTLIDFACIPDYVSKAIIDQYNQPIQGNKQKIFDYLLKHQCNLLLNYINDFTN